VTTKLNFAKGYSFLFHQTIKVLEKCKALAR
jgi:hypothetical protein